MKIFSSFPHISIEPQGRAIFCPRAIILTNMVEVYLVMLHTKYQGCRTSGFRQEAFLAQGYNLNKIGRGLLGDSNYQISTV